MQQILDCNRLRDFGLEANSDEVLEVFRESFRVLREPGRVLAELGDGEDRARAFGKFADGELVQRHAHAPQIGLEAVRQPLCAAGRHVAERAAEGLARVVVEGLHALAGDAEVGDLDAAHVGDEDVVGLDVAVQLLLGVVQVVQAVEHLVEHGAEVRFGEGAVGVEGVLERAGHQVHDDVEHSVLVENSVASDEKRRGEIVVVPTRSPQDADFLLDFIDGVGTSYYNFLDGVIIVGILVSHSQHSSSSTLADHYRVLSAKIRQTCHAKLSSAQSASSDTKSVNFDTIVIKSKIQRWIAIHIIS